MNMNMPSLITDNIAELLTKIIEFTQIRQKILIRNIKSMCSPGFVPQDLTVEEFCHLLSNAVDEHVANGRLILKAVIAL